MLAPPSLPDTLTSSLNAQEFIKSKHCYVCEEGRCIVYGRANHLNPALSLCFWQSGGNKASCE